MASTGIIAEAGTIPSRSLVEDLFLQLPTDARFHQVTNQKIVPATGLDDRCTQITFNLPPLDLPNVYFIQDTLLECRLVITKADGKTLPDKSAKVCFVNNALGSLFSNVSLSINDALITTTSSNYSYKDYLQTLLSYPSDAKSFLQSKGWFPDSPYQFTGIENNAAYAERSKLLRRNFSSTGDFKPEGFTLIDRLYHDLASSNHFIPSLTKVQFTLTKNNDKFFILKLKSDTEEYKVNILSCVLYVPVGIMSDRMASDLMAKWTHTPIQYFYERLEVKTITMPSNKQEFLSDSLFPQSEHPSRVYIMLVDTDAYLGNYTKSPYCFQRKWQIEIKASQLSTSYSSTDAENTMLKRSIDELKSQMEFLVQMSLNFSQSQQINSNIEEDDEPLTQKRAKRYKNKKAMQNKDSNTNQTLNNVTTITNPIASTSQENNERQSTSMWTRLFNKNLSTNNRNLCSETASISSHSSSIVEDQTVNERSLHDEPGPAPAPAPAPAPTPAPTPGPAPGPTPDPPNPVNKKTIWVTKCQLEINSSPIDQFESNCTEDDAMQDFIRFQKTISQFHNVYSCGIDYEEFMTNSYICAFDLTTSQTPGLAYCINSVRTGHMRLRIRFNESCPADLTVIVMGEYPAHLELSKTGLVKTSYSPK